MRSRGVNKRGTRYQETPVEVMSVVRPIIPDASSYLLEFQEHLLSIFLSISWTMHRVIDDKVISAKLVNDIRVAFAPVLSEVLLNNLEVLCLFLSRHCVAG